MHGRSLTSIYSSFEANAVSINSLDGGSASGPVDDIHGCSISEVAVLDVVQEFRMGQSMIQHSFDVLCNGVGVAKM